LPSERNRFVRKIIPKKIKIELATPASTPRRLKTIPSGAAIRTTTMHAHGSAAGIQGTFENGANAVRGKS
jgi:hypothetical protein